MSRISNEELLELDVKVLVPAALENQINASNADKIKADIIVEAANGPIAAEADETLNAKGIIVVPDILLTQAALSFLFRMGTEYPVCKLDRRNRE